MKAQRNASERSILVTDITGEYAKVEELRIDIRYREGGVSEAITLDNVIIPRIVKALDDDEHISSTLDLVAEHDEVVDAQKNLQNLADAKNDELSGVLLDAVRKLDAYRHKLLDDISARVSAKHSSD